MIPQVALILWIFVSIALFAAFSPLRAFMLTYLLGLLFLPVEVTNDHGQWVGSIVFTQSIRIEKLAACHIGAIMGTLLFAPHVLRRFRFHWIDMAFAVVVLGQFATSVVNNLGAKDGFSNAVQLLRDYLPIVVLSRLYIVSFSDLLEAARVVIGGALIYSAVCILEWRLSPQMHTTVYGYFQHSFSQFVRYGSFRPIGFLRHAIELSAFMAMSSVLAAWLMMKGMFKPLWGFVPNFILLPALLLGLASTMTRSGYAEFIIGLLVLGGIVLFRTRWLLLVLPVVAILWIGGRYTGALSPQALLSVAGQVAPEHVVDSFAYRLSSEELNLKLTSGKFWLGQASQKGAARDLEGDLILALDAQWLIVLVFYGMVGLAGWFLFWTAPIFAALRRWRKLGPEARALSAVVCVLVGAQLIDFLINNFPSMPLLILTVGCISALQHYRVAVRRVVWVPAGVQGVPTFGGGAAT